jgi:hypothetical protein
MNRFFTTCALAGVLFSNSVDARQPELLQPTIDEALPSEGPPLHTNGELQLHSDFSAASCDSCEPSCETEQQSCGCDASCGCENGCSSGCCCDSGWGWDLNCLGDCCLGDAWTLKDCLTPGCCGPTYGGWISAGYYNHNERLSFDRADELSINDFPHHLNLDQAWFYVEKAAEANGCCADYGYRFDIAYGAQIHAAQSFGNSGGTWDVTWDHGPYEWAIPQLYGEVAFGDWSVKAGHFFTPAGYEVVPATGNFFYSHALTWYNSEPFMHTGVLGTYTPNDCWTYYAGWALGWDTGFDQFDGGNIFIGGATYNATEDIALTYVTTVGNLGWKTNGEFGYTHHIVGTFALSECWEYVIQHDYLNLEGTFADADVDGEDKGVTNYLFYTLNDCWKLGGRAEWWRTDSLTGESASLYEVTGGVNYHPHANLVIRPEIRYDWTPSNEAINDDYNQTWFGVDAVLTF